MKAIPIKFIGKYILVPAILLAAGAFGGFYFFIDSGKAAYEKAAWYNVEDGGIDESRFVNLGGHEQFVRIRSRFPENPVLIYLHGGPGSAVTDVSHRVFRPLTEYFTLVEWDQRGAGKSAGDESIYDGMNYQRMVDDTVALIEYLQQRLNQDKVILVGQSWGSMLGLGVIKQRPDLIHAYVGVGQGMAWQATLNESQRLMLEAANTRGDSETVEALSAIPEQWPAAGEYEANRNRVRSVQKHLPKFRGGYYATLEGGGLPAEFLMDAIFTPDAPFSALFALLGWGGGPKITATTHLREELWGWSLLDKPEYYSYEVPMFMFQGDHDWQTPTTLVKEWFAKVEAPYKEYVPFEHSAHFVITEQPAKFIYSLVDKVRPLALPQM